MTQLYTTEAQRVGKLKGALLKHSIPREVLGISGEQHKMPKNNSDTIIFRRWVPFGGAATNSTTINEWVVNVNDHLTQEGVTPEADTITPQDISVQMKQYSCLYVYTDKTAELYEDDVPAAMKKQAGQRMGLLRERIRYGEIKGGTNKFYGGTGTTRGTVNGKLTLNMLRKITRSLENNRADQITQILTASPLYNTAPVEAGYIVFCHSDVEADIRNIEGFLEVAGYGSRKPLHPRELGSTDKYRFITSPELDEYPAAGASVGTTGLLSAGGSNIDIYPVIVIAEDAWGDVALRGMDSFDVTHIPHNKKDKNDPLGQRGYLGASFWSATFIQNDGWMAVAEVGVTDL